VTYLLDINVLVALFDQAHVHHEPAHRWFAAKSLASWATCPLTENGFVRVISNPGYKSVSATPAEAAQRLQILCSAPEHIFWPDTLSLTDVSRFDLAKLRGHRQITDLYLAGLAHHHGGKLVTFDANIPVAAVVGASRDLVELIPSK
jgi:toxin-antitoxin system PIN domain toxin